MNRHRRTRLLICSVIVAAGLAAMVGLMLMFYFHK